MNQLDQDQQLDQLNIFLSYARIDGERYAANLHRSLTKESPRFQPWYDRQNLSVDRSFQLELEDAISTADVMIVVLTRNVPDREWCRKEIAFALRHQVKIVIAKMEHDVREQLALVDLTPIDFAADYNRAYSELVEYLKTRAGPRGVVDELRLQIDAAENTADLRYQGFVAENRERQQQEVDRAAGPPKAQSRVQARIDARLSQEQWSESQLRTHQDMRLINEMPAVAKTEFWDRTAALTQLDDALADREIKAVLVTGEPGSGKTAMIGEVRQRLGDRRFRAQIDGFVYLASGGYRLLSAAALLHDLNRLAPDDTTEVEVGRLLQENRPWHEKLDAVLAGIGTTPAVVALDDVDGLLDKTGMTRDEEFDTLLRELVRRDDHGIRLLLTSGGPAPEWLGSERRRVRECKLDGGLPLDEMKKFLRSLDSTRILTPDTAPEPAIRRLAVVSKGNPRFVELTYSLLRSDPNASLAAALADIAPEGANTTLEEATTALLRRIISRLDRTQRRIVQVLAAFGRPVHPEAVDFVLQDYAPGVESEPILNGLEERHLIRRDEDRYFLPPDPDAKKILKTVPPGKEADWTSRPRLFTRTFLLSRAAQYFSMAGERAAARGIATLDDLQPQFNEIDLRIAAGAFPQAVYLMEELETKYLIRMGQSHVLESWRQAAQGNIGDPVLEMHNLSFLVAAREGEEDHEGSNAARLASAGRYRRRFRDAPQRIDLLIQGADLESDNGRLSLAARRYRAGARESRFRPGMRHEEAMARIGLGMCLARRGQFRRAEAQLAKAHRLASSLDGDLRAETVAITLLDQGWLYGQVGDRTRALELHDEGLTTVEGLEDLLWEGRLCDGKAALLCDEGQANHAVRFARRAAEIGVRTRDIGLARQAYVTLALAYLHLGELDDAAAAVTAAVHQPPGIWALGAWVTYGVVLFRRHDVAGAGAAFHTALTEAWLRLTREPNEYSTHDAAGLALCGLELCGERNRLDEAVESYRLARRIAAADGVRQHAVTQLQLFGDTADQKVLTKARRAANGESPA